VAQLGEHRGSGDLDRPQGMMHAARIMTLVGIDLYADPVHLERARREFRGTHRPPVRRTARRCPDDLAAPRYPERAGLGRPPGRAPAPSGR